MAVGARDYPTLIQRSDPLDIGGGVAPDVLRLEEIIAMKEELGREKELAALPMLRATLRLSHPSTRPPPAD